MLDCDAYNGRGIVTTAPPMLTASRRILPTGRHMETIRRRIHTAAGRGVRVCGVAPTPLSTKSRSSCLILWRGSLLLAARNREARDVPDKNRATAKPPFWHTGNSRDSKPNGSAVWTSGKEDEISRMANEDTPIFGG